MHESSLFSLVFVRRVMSDRSVNSCCEFARNVTEPNFSAVKLRRSGSKEVSEKNQESTYTNYKVTSLQRRCLRTKRKYED